MAFSAGGHPDCGPAGSADSAQPLIGAGERGTQPPMTRIFDLDDHARLPWRFFGAARAVLGRL
ncbi:MAG: hypothetical protein QNJ16_06895 [Rhodobacter sp.]|nr:hypothetical protein [Rhodobacter sp.]